MAQLDADVRTALAQAAIDRWLDVDESGALGWLSTAAAIVESGAIKLPEIGPGDRVDGYRPARLDNARTRPREKRSGSVSANNRARAIGLLASVTDRLATTDPRSALIWVNGLPEESRGAAVYAAIGRTWAKKDPVAALE